MDIHSLLSLIVLSGIGIWIASVMCDSLRFRAQRPALVRAAVTLSQEQTEALSDKQILDHLNALDYARRYKRGALKDSPELEAASRRIDAERRCRSRRELGRLHAQRIARNAEKKARAFKHEAQRKAQARKRFGL